MKIIGINRDLTSTVEGMADRYLTLDSTPNSAWVQLFEDIHREDMDLQKRNIRIENRWIIVKCPLADTQQQIEKLNAICKEADGIIAEHEQKKTLEENARRAILVEQTDKANEVFDNLKFD